MRIAIALIAALTTACVANNEEPDPNTNPNTQQSIIPQQGQWYYADVTQISSTCLAGDDGVAGDFLIQSTSAAGFTVLDGDTDPFSCSLTGSAFNCPNRAAYTEDMRPNIDAVLVAHATAQGSFSSATRGTGSQDATVTCTGSACSAAGTWPCTFKVNFEIRAM